MEVGAPRATAVLAVALVLLAPAALGSWVGGGPASFAASPQPPPVQFFPGDASAVLGPNQTSASITVYGSTTTTIQVVSNPTFTGTPEPWFYAEDDPNGYVSAAYDATNEYVYMTGNIPAGLGYQATTAILQQVTIPATGTVYGSVDWAYTLSTGLLFGAIYLYVVVYDANWSLVTYTAVATLTAARNAPAWQTFNFDFSGQLPAPGTYYVGLLAAWYGDWLWGYTATVYMDNFYLYVDDPSLYGAVSVDNALQITNLAADVNWTAKLRVDAYAANGTVDWVNVTLVDRLGNAANPEISYSAGALQVPETGNITITTYGDFYDTVYIRVRGKLNNPGDTLVLNMTLILGNGAGTIIEYPVSLTVTQP